MGKKKYRKYKKKSVAQITRDQDSDIFHNIASGMFNICHHNSYLLEPILLKT